MSNVPGSQLTRRALLGQFAVGALAVSGIAALLKGSYRGSSLGGTTASTQPTGAGQPSTTGHQAASSGSAAGADAVALPANAVKLGPSSRLASGQGATYSDPLDGSPDIVIRQSDGSLRSFSAVCTHAGCTVGYQGGEIVCPCHGGVFSAQTGAVVGGPPPQGLAAKKVLEHSGQIYAVPS